MGPLTSDLLNVLDELVDVLEWDGCHWAEWMRKSRSEIKASDFHGVERLLSAYGGMGSFNDLTIGYRTNSDGILEQRSGYGTKNQLLECLRSRAYDIATELKRTRNPGA